MSGPVEREIKCMLRYFLSMNKEKWMNVWTGAGVLNKKDQEQMSPADSVSCQDMASYVKSPCSDGYYQGRKVGGCLIKYTLLFWATDGRCDISIFWSILYLCLCPHSLFHPFSIVRLHYGKLCRPCWDWCQILSLGGQQPWYYIISISNQEFRLKKKHWWSWCLRCHPLVEYGVLVMCFVRCFLGHIPGKEQITVLTWQLNSTENPET